MRRVMPITIGLICGFVSWDIVLNDGAYAHAFVQSLNDFGLGKVLRLI